MGKSNKKRLKQHKPCKSTLSQETKNKLGVLVEMKSGNKEEERIGNLLEVLRSQSYDEDLVCALATLSSFMIEGKAAKVFLGLNGPEMVSNFLVHSSQDIREKALGTLRNVLITCGENCIRSYLNNGVVVNLTQILKGSSRLTEERSLRLHEEVCKELKIKEFLCDALEFYTNLCEAPEVMDNIELEFMLKFLISVIGDQDLMEELRVKAAQCLYVISEDNKLLADLIITVYPWFMESSMKKGQASHSTVKIYSMGVVYNLSCMVMLEKAGTIYEEIIREIGHLLQCVVSMLRDEDNQDGSEVDIISLICEYFLLCDCCCCHHEQAPRLDNLKFGLELFSNIICHDKDGSEDDWQDVEECEVTEEDFGGCDDSMMEEIEDSSYVELFKEINLNKHIFYICSLPKSHFNGSLQSVKESWLKLYYRSWQFLSNLVALSTSEMVSESEVTELWNVILKIILKENGELEATDNSFIEAVSCAMRAVGEKMILYENTDMVCTSDAMSMISKLINGETSESTRMNFVSIMGMVGKHICTSEKAEDVLKIIGDVFSSILSSNTKDVLLIAEVLDASFDSFADGPCVDQVLASTGLFAAMKNINVMMNSLTKEDKRKLGNKLGIVAMAKTNLAGFIKYKEKR